MNGRPVRTRTADLYRVNAPLLCTSNNLQRAEDCINTRKYGQAGIITGEITGEEICRANSPAQRFPTTIELCTQAPMAQSETAKPQDEKKYAALLNCSQRLEDQFQN